MIESIVDTYELSREKKERIARIATRRIKELSINEYNEIYRYIDSLVNKFNPVTPYIERFFMRLDSPVKDGSKILFHELVKFSDYWQEDTDYFGTKSISLKELLGILKSQLDYLDSGLIYQLFSNAPEDLVLKVSPEYILKTIPQIQSRLEQLAKENNGRFAIPKKPIIEIQLHPLLIKFGRRNFKRNPLAFLREHSLYYGWITKRTELFQFDPSLYEALRRWEQLDLAIPNIIPPGSTTKIPLEKEIKIIDALQNFKSPTKIAKELGVTRAAVDYYGIKHKVRTPRKKTGNPGYSEKIIEDVVECLKKCEKASKVAQCFGISRYTVVKHGRKAGVPILSRGGDINNILKNRKKNNK